MTFCYNKLYDEDDEFMSVLQGEGGGEEEERWRWFR